MRALAAVPAWVLLAAALAAAGPAAARAPSPPAPQRCADHDDLRRPFFGDLHVHTRYSLDASTQGTTTSPRDAYRFARGERIGLHPFAPDGTPLRHARLSRPLDFAAVTDHAELLGEAAICNTPGLAGHDAFVCRVYRRWPRLSFFLMNARGAPRFRFCGPGGVGCRDAARGPWRDIREAAAAAQDRTSACGFTSFVALEWTQSGPGAANLHRNVVFRGEVVPEDPPNALDQPTKEALWDVLDAECRGEDGCEAVVIPHNSNISGELMFRIEGADGGPLTAEEARRRAAREPLVEIMQHKGASECRRSSAPADELCGFENLPYDRFMGRYLPALQRDAAPLNFTRHAQAAGLVLQQEIGANPFAFGVVGSTDTHLGAAGLVEEAADYPGHGGAGTPIGDTLPEGFLDPVEFNPGGLAVLWAEENSREALFAALRRREAYGTSGPRIVLRLFAGWELPDDACERSDLARVGYERGVPMGGELDAAPEAGAPRVAVLAQADPDGQVPLQRLQIVKAWAKDGEAHERVYDVAGDPHGHADVDPATCEPRGAGFARLCSVWRDPDFDPEAPALYYARAVENPVCRWTARFCRARGVDCADPASVPPGLDSCCDPELPMTVQERAWSSPVWYAPAAGP